MFSEKYNGAETERRFLPREEVEKIFCEGHQSAGHGTHIENASEILANGIRVNPAYGQNEILLPLSGLSNQEIDSLLSAWPHKNAKAIVIVCVAENDDFAGSDKVVGKIFDEKMERERSYIPPNFIKGYFDVDQEVFVDNPKWEMNAAPLGPIPRYQGLPRRVNKVDVPVVKAAESGEVEVW